MLPSETQDYIVPGTEPAAGEASLGNWALRRRGSLLILLIMKVGLEAGGK